MKTQKTFRPTEKQEYLWLGEPVRWYDVGPYTIFEYHPWKRDGITVLTGQPDETINEFHGWIGGKNTHTGWESLDAALAGLIAFRHDGANSQAGHYFINGLRKDEHEHYKGEPAS